MENSALQIVALCCEHCAYAAADLAGGLRMQYSPQVKIIQIPCSGKLDVLLALHAFEAGADGLMVAGCLPGDCHYLDGNVKARRRVQRVQHLLKEIGLEPERIRMFNLSAAMAAEFVSDVTQMTETITNLGPNPLRKHDDALIQGP